MAREKFLGLKLTLSESNQLEKEALALELTKTDYVKLLMRKGKDHLNDDYRNLQLKKMSAELDILKRQMAGMITNFNVFASDFNKKEKLSRRMNYEIMKTVFEARSISRKIVAGTFEDGEKFVLSQIELINDHFKNNLYKLYFGGEK